MCGNSRPPSIRQTKPKQGHDRVRKVAECLDEKGLATLRNARRAAGEIGGLLEAQGQVDLQPRVEELRGYLSGETLLESLPSIRAASTKILAAYRTLYEGRHADRTEQFRAAIEKVKGRKDWTVVPESMQGPVLTPLRSRCCNNLKLSEGFLACESCRAGLGQMESDVAAIGGLVAGAVAQIQKLVTPPDTPLRRVRVAEFFAGPLDDEVQIKQAVARLQEHLLKLLGEGVKVVVE